MNFNNLLEIAHVNKQNKPNTKGFSTAIAPAKKPPRSNVPSVAVKNFLEKREQMERQKEVEAKRQRERLLALRAQNSKSNKAAKLMSSRTKDNDFSRIRLTEDEVETKKKMEVQLQRQKLTDKVERMKARIKIQEEQEALPHKRKRKSKVEGQPIEVDNSPPSPPKEIPEKRMKLDGNWTHVKPKGNPKTFRSGKAPKAPLSFNELLRIAAEKQKNPNYQSEEEVEEFSNDEGDDERLMTKKERFKHMEEQEHVNRMSTKKQPAKNERQLDRPNSSARPVERKNQSQHNPISNGNRNYAPSSRPPMNNSRPATNNSRPATNNSRLSMNNSRPNSNSKSLVSSFNGANKSSSQNNARSSTSSANSRLPPSQSNSRDTRATPRDSRLASQDSRLNSRDYRPQPLSNNHARTSQPSSKSTREDISRSQQSRPQSESRVINDVSRNGQQHARSQNRPESKTIPSYNTAQSKPRQSLSQNSRPQNGGRPISTQNSSNSNFRSNGNTAQNRPNSAKPSTNSKRPQNDQQNEYVPSYTTVTSAKKVIKPPSRLRNVDVDIFVEDNSPSNGPINHPSSKPGPRSTNPLVGVNLSKTTIRPAGQTLLLQSRPNERTSSNLSNQPSSSNNPQRQPARGRLEERRLPPPKRHPSPSTLSQRPGYAPSRHDPYPPSKALARNPYRKLPPITSSRPVRRIESDDEDDEDDEEMREFIDDDPIEDMEDYSRHIKEIFGYDKHRYLFDDDFDDEAMESNYAQQMKEELTSARLGFLEDMEDMKKEQEEMKRKQFKNKPR